MLYVYIKWQLFKSDWFIDIFFQYLFDVQLKYKINKQIKLMEF